MELLLTGAFRYSEEQLEKIRSLGYIVTFVSDERAPLKMDVSRFEAVVCNGLFLYNDISRFTSLKFIQLTSAGLDRVPMDYINEHNIRIANAGGVYSIPMAEWVILKILEIYKKSRSFYDLQKKNRWEKQNDLWELAGKTAAIIGFGDVGKEVAKRLRPFGVKITAVDTRDLKPEEKGLVDDVCRPEEIEDILRKTDILILSLSLTEKTRHFIDKSRLSSMKNSSILINVSRGGVIDESALIESLQGGRFLGVALDVFEKEPLPQNSPLWGMRNVIITPHNSFVSDRISERLFNLIISNLVNNKIE